LVDCGQGGSNGQGQNQQGAAIEVLPASSFDPGPNGGADLPEPTFLIVVRECYAALRARSFDALALPRDPKHQLELLLLRGQMVASAGRQRLGEASAFLGRAAALAPGQAAQLEQELAAASGASPSRWSR